MFYQRILQYLSEYSVTGRRRLTVNIAFEYFNTSSSKCLYDIFKRLRKVKATGRELIINWYYEQDDEDMMEAGEDYSDLLDLDFNFLEIEE